MKDSPDMFHGLELEYIINGQRSSRRKVSVAGTSITSGKLFTELDNLPGAEGSSVRYITSGDLKTIVQESTSNVLASVTTDSDYVDTGDEVSVANLLERVLGRDKVTTDSFTPHMWNSVFWNPTWARPDKFVSFLNKALEKDTSDSKNFLLTEYAKTSSARGSGGGSFLKIFSAKAEGGSESSKSEKVHKEDLLSTLRERHSNIEWTGEVFKVKPMKMHRLNLANLNTSASITVANLQIHR